MTSEADRVAAALLVSMGLLRRRLRQTHDGELTLPELSALARLDRVGPMTVGALAKLEQISAQSVGTTISALERRGLVVRAPDTLDGRRVVLSPTKDGARALRKMRRRRTDGLARALATEFSPHELEQLMAAAPLIERLAQRL